MRAGKVQDILKISKPTLLKRIEDYTINTEKTPFGENIFRWKHIARLQYLHDFQDVKQDPVVISICQNKGGVGKTTSVINLATIFSYIGKTLVIDLDSQANLSQSFNLYTSDEDICLVDALKDNENAKSSLHNIAENLDIIPNNLKFERWKRQAKNNNDLSFSLQKVLKKVKDDYRFILIDTPPALDTSLEIALYASDYCLIPFEPDSFSMEGISNIFEEIEYIHSEDKTGFFNVKKLGLFITQFEKNSLSEQISEHIQNNYDVFETKIRKAIAVKQSQAVKQNIFDYDESCTATYDYYNLAFETLRRIYK